MSDYRRYYVAGATFFFTVVTYHRQRILTCELSRKCLHEALEEIRKNRPVEIPAIVLLPDHLHVMWTLPAGDDDYSTRWRRIKEEFTQRYLDGGGREVEPSASRKSRGERGIWQRRYWEHTIRNEWDFERHFDYIHYNPVKHGYVASPADWPYSSFHRWVESGVYTLQWGRGELKFDDLNETAME